MRSTQDGPAWELPAKSSAFDSGQSIKKKLAIFIRQFYLFPRGTGSSASLFWLGYLLIELQKKTPAQVLRSEDKSARAAAEAGHTDGILFGVECGNERRPANYFPYDFHILGTTSAPQLAKGALLLRA